jgi:hypothetical protein
MPQQACQGSINSLQGCCVQGYRACAQAQPLQIGLTRVMSSSRHLTTVLAFLLRCRRPLLQSWAHLTSLHATSSVSVIHAWQLQHVPTQAVASVTVVSPAFPCTAHVTMHRSCVAQLIVACYTVLAESSKYFPPCDGTNTRCGVSRVFASVQGGLAGDASSEASNGSNRSAEALSFGM